MRTIWKRPIDADDGGEFTIVAVNPRIVHVGHDPAGMPCVWFEHELHDGVPQRQWAAVRRQLHCRVYGTGDHVESGWSHVGSFVQGVFVWHVYARDFTVPT